MGTAESATHFTFSLRAGRDPAGRGRPFAKCFK